MPVQALRGALASARDRGTHIYCVTVPCGHALRAALHADPLLVLAALLLFAAALILALAAVGVAIVAGAAATKRAKRFSAVAAVALVAFSARWWQQDARAESYRAERALQRLQLQPAASRPGSVGPHRMAVCYWGMTRSTALVYESHLAHVHGVLRAARIDFRVFLHTWSTTAPQRVWGSTVAAPVNLTEHALLQPDVWARDEQEKFLATIRWDDYHYKLPPHGVEWDAPLVRNFLCALESQRRVLALVERYQAYAKEHFTHVAFLRPDVRILSDLPVAVLPRRGDFVIADTDHFSGLNDRFALLAYADAASYARRILELPSYRWHCGGFSSEGYVSAIALKHGLTPVPRHFSFEIVRPPGGAKEHDKPARPPRRLRSCNEWLHLDVAGAAPGRPLPTNRERFGRIACLTVPCSVLVAETDRLWFAEVAIAAAVPVALIIALEPIRHLRMERPRRALPPLAVLHAALASLFFGMVRYFAPAAEPVSFSIPDGVWRATEALRNGSSRIPRRRDFAAAVAGVEASQPFRAGSAAGRSQPEAQAEYYKAYAGARFAVTSKKGGWDCLRHYEIVLAGAMPFFLGIDALPPAAMPTWPRDIVRHAMALPGVPSEAAVAAAVGAGARLPPIDRSRFPQAEYEKLRRKLLDDAATHLLASHTARRLLLAATGTTAATASLPCAHVLVHSLSEARQDYQRDLLVIGLVELGATVYATFDAAHLFRSFPPERFDDALRFGYYHGRGFTYGRSLDDALRGRVRAWPPSADAPPPCAYFKTTASNRGWPADDLVRAPPPAHVDGNDIPADAAWHPRRWSYLDAAPDRRAPLFVREPEGEARVVAL